VELSEAYAKQGASSVNRGFAFTKRYEQLLVVDEIDFPAADNVTWAVHTLAAVHVRGASATLSLGGIDLHANIVEPHGATFISTSVELEPPQKPSDGLNKLMIQLPMANSSTSRIVVGLSLSRSASTPLLNPLAQWKETGPFSDPAFDVMLM